MTPSLRPDLPPVRRLWLRVVAPLMALFLFATTGCVTTGTNPVSGNQRAVGYSWEEEVQLGQEADKQIQQQYGVYDDADLSRYVENLGQTLLAVSHMRRDDTDPKFRNTEFTFRVLDSPIVNAFALPGGYVYVSRGLMAHLNNEAQLAVVLGHEIGHVAARHASQRAARQQLTQGLLVAGAVAGQATLGGDAAQNIIGLGGQAAQFLTLSYSRDNERESDRLGVEYATRVGYEASEGAAFFTSLKRIQEQGGQSIPSWKSTHPDPGEREGTIRQLAQEWEQRVGGSADELGRSTFLRRVEGIVLGEDPRQGFTENDVFYHPELEFQFPLPRGWQVQNTPTQVAVVQPNQEAFVVFQFAQESSPGAAAASFTGQEGLTVVERRSTTVNGNDAERVLAEAQQQNGGTVRILSYFIAYGGNVYSFQGITTAQKYDTYQSDFTQTMTQFARLTDPDKLNVEPTRLTVVDASRTGAFRTFVDVEELPDGMTVEDLAIINQVQVDETIQAGQPLKLPR